MLQLCHAVTPMLAGLADWRRGGGGQLWGGIGAEEEGGGCGVGEVNNRQIVSASRSKAMAVLKRSVRWAGPGRTGRPRES